ncbi:tetratricopeptide repeat protein [Treponema pectinovorum]|uniref:tetratricopeptide repeat protein n=1 Tax=Treponema pectinovorum TaxID=164 RepID=UPI0011C87FF4|nr:tetratricopeptide repeat protein [Treponema pectinovorum]
MKFNILPNGKGKRKSHLVRNIIAVGLIALVFSALIFFVHHFLEKYIFKGDSTTHLVSKWNDYDYEEVYKISNAILEKKPFNNTALTYHGYASFYLSLAENDTSLSQSYCDEAITNIRLALQTAKSRLVPQLEYMLGKAYFYKNTVSSYYYYADLAVLYLNRAIKDGYKSDDIPEYLGLSYASLGMTMESISAFTKALLTRESDLLLLSIAEQYYNAGQAVASEQYLFRISAECNDQKINERSHLLLGKIYTEQKKNEQAKKEFESILEKNENFGDALYGLGVVYENEGDIIKARSYWRKALKVQANHPDSLKKLAEYK